MQGAAVTLTELGEYSQAAAFLEKLAKVCFSHAFIFLMSSYSFHKNMLIRDLANSAQNGILAL